MEFSPHAALRASAMAAGRACASIGPREGEPGRQAAGLSARASSEWSGLVEEITPPARRRAAAGNQLGS
jgi:hypothetical protein